MNVDDFMSILELGLGEHFVRYLLKPSRMGYAIKLLFLLLKMLVIYPFVSPLKIEAHQNKGSEEDA